MLMINMAMSILQTLTEMAAAKPRGGQFFQNDGREDPIQKIHSVSRGYAYIDTGTSVRDVVPAMDLVHTGKTFRGKPVWADRSYFK